MFPLRIATGSTRATFHPILRLSRKSILLIGTLLALCLIITPSRARQQDWVSLSKPLIMAWVYNIDDISDFTPAVTGEMIYLPLVNGTLVAIEAHTGAFQWRAEIGGNISASPISDESGVYIATEIINEGRGTKTVTTGALHSIGKRSGLTNWVQTLSAPVRSTLATNQDMLFVVTVDGKLYSIKKTTGEIVWVKNNTSPFVSPPLAAEGKLYLGDENGSLHAFEQTTGRTIWRYRTRDSLRSLSSAVGGMIYAGSSDTFVYALSAKSGKLKWRTRAGAGMQSVLATPQCVLATALDNFVYCLSPQSGRRIWKRQLPGRVLSRPLTDADAILLAPLAGDECIVLNLADGKKINSIKVGEENNTAASPVRAGAVLLITTRQGLMAYANSR